jgi:hypothetical protein
MRNAMVLAMKVQGYWVIVSLLAVPSLMASPMPPLGPETVETYQARFPGELTLVVYRQALQTNDHAVADAAFYNQLHVLSAATITDVAQ